MASPTESKGLASVGFDRVGRDHVILILPAKPAFDAHKWIEKASAIGGKFTIFVNAQAWGARVPQHSAASAIERLAGLTGCVAITVLDGGRGLFSMSTVSTLQTSKRKCARQYLKQMRTMHGLTPLAGTALVPKKKKP